MAEQRAKGGKKNRKVGRNAARCLAYASRHQRERNKVRRLRRHLQRHQKDQKGWVAYMRLEQFLPKELRLEHLLAA